MSKQNKNSDPLEEFFREKSQDYDIEYREQDWRKLEARLDTADQQRQQRRKRWLAAAVVAMLFVVLAYITYDQQLEINELNDRLSKNENVTTPPPSESSPDKPSDAAGDSQEGQEVLAEESKQASESEEQAKTTGDQNGHTTLPSEEQNQQAQQAGQHNENTLALTTIKFTEKSLVTAKASPGFDGRSTAISAIKPTSFPPPGDAKTRQAPPAQTSNPEILTHRHAPRFTVGVLVGPDLSTVGGMSNFYNPGYKFGLSLEYNITQNLAISAGAQRTKVRYVASGDEYSPPPGYWSYGVVPDKTVGECILIDIPVSLKYDFLHFQHSRLFATVGLSSYIMLDEDYRFRYDQMNTSNLKQRWHERTGTSHWMSNATFSVGYELDISQQLSLRAEPFVKLPLKKVGWGNVNLYSMGTTFSINYKIR